jgi:hypothetical protein
MPHALRLLRKTLQTLHRLLALSTDTVGKILTGMVVFTMMTTRSFLGFQVSAILLFLTPDTRNLHTETF